MRTTLTLLAGLALGTAATTYLHRYGPAWLAYLFARGER